MPIPLPPELERVRDLAHRVILPIKPADSSTQAEKEFLFSATRTEAGRKLPPYHLVYFLLVDLLNFRDLGRFEKLAWSIPIDFEGRAFLIEHRKFGVGVFAPAGDEWEAQAKRIVGLIGRGVRVAKPYFRWMADNAIQASKLNVRNVGDKLFERYTFFRDSFKVALVETQTLKSIRETNNKQREFLPSPFGASVKEKTASTEGVIRLFTHPDFKRAKDASWLALAAVEAFFGWTEHIFIHIAILQGNFTTGEQVAQIAESDWGTKFKKALDIGDKSTKSHFDKLVTIRRQLRNFVAHGAFGKEGEAFHFHSRAGAVPVVLDHTLARAQFSLSPELAFEDTEALAMIEEFIVHLWSGSREPARIYIQESGLPLILPNASDGTYARAMSSVDEMREFVDHLSEQWDAATNMDW